MIKLNQLGKSFRYAFKGFVYVFKHEQNFRIQLFAGLLVVVLIFVLGINRTQAAILVLVVTMVLILELFNTVTERISDVLKPRVHHYVEVIKDIMAAAVFISSIGAIIIGLLIIGPYVAQIWLK